MNGYKAFWNYKECEVYAATSAGAQDAAVIEFKKSAGRKKVKPSDVIVILCQIDDTQIYHPFVN